MKTKKRITLITVIAVFLLVLATRGVCEYTIWDCPECGRTGNTGNFCGGCGCPATTNDGGPSERRANRSVAIGDIITFGTYPQTSEGTDQTPIEWIVLDIQEGKALLLSKHGLDAKPFNTKHKDITWEKCTLRIWMNNTFLRSAFTDKERLAILTTNVDNSDSQGYRGWRTTGGNNTEDQIFLLSYAEAKKYLEVAYKDAINKKSCVSPTAYAKAQGASANSDFKTDDENAAGWWWLRSPGYYQSNAARVYSGGWLRDHSVSNACGSVRPALWINLESDIV